MHLHLSEGGASERTDLRGVTVGYTKNNRYFFSTSSFDNAPRMFNTTESVEGEEEKMEMVSRGMKVGALGKRVDADLAFVCKVVPKPKC
ncbi:hypothetical protein R1flu_024076 [Riccia fluitans]|uniref:Uncharacterized protein n=1 Tax=Riccia fluitans TaxID=41844 RepID=A0ABD1XTY0_9MARC